MSPESPQPTPCLPLPRGSMFCARAWRLTSMSEAHVSAHLHAGLSCGEVHVPGKVQTCLQSVCARVRSLFLCSRSLSLHVPPPSPSSVHLSPSSVSASAHHYKAECAPPCTHSVPRLYQGGPVCATCLPVDGRVYPSAHSAAQGLRGELSNSYFQDSAQGYGYEHTATSTKCSGKAEICE